MRYIQTEGSFDAVTSMPTAGWIGESEQKQTPFIRIPVVVTSEGPEKGAGAVWTGYLSNAAFENTIKRLAEVFGFDGNLAALATGKQTLANMPCSITTEAEDYNGKRRIKIKWLNAPGGGSTAKPMDPGKLDLFLKQTNSRAMLVAQSIGKAPEKVEAETDDTDSVPF